MKKIFYLFLLVTILPGFDVYYGMSVSKESGNSVYNVYSVNKKARLTFPVSVYTAGLEGKYDKIGFYIRLPLKKNVTDSKDCDYIDSKLAVMSESENYLTCYRNAGIYYDSDYYLDFNYALYSFLWKKTLQDGVLYGDTVRYKSSRYLIKLGKNFSLFKIYLITGYVRNKDSHLLRGFYTLQNGYVKGFGGKMNYCFSKRASVKLGFEKFYFDGDMRYYEANTGYYYLKLKSDFYSYKYVVSFVYKFK